jgi:glycosyltransferase involved in cell wall biosynthesis
MGYSLDKLDFSMPMNPVTVLMAVYNGMPYIDAAIESILSQTYTDIEFVIVENGSTDGTPAILDAYQKKDTRIRVIHTKKGFVRALNLGLEQAKGKYIVRMDVDDISLPDRIQKQVEFMELHPKVGLCGCWVRRFGAESTVTKYPTKDKNIRSSLLFSNPFAHPAVIIRSSILKQYNLVYQDVAPLEDYDLWVRLAKVTQFANLPEILLQYRIHPSQITQSLQIDLTNSNKKKIYESQITQLGLSPNADELTLHHQICGWNFVNDKQWVNKAEIWLRKLATTNQGKNIYPEPEFKQAIGNLWWQLCSLARPGLVPDFVKSPIGGWTDMSVMDKILKIMKSILRPLINAIRWML